MHMFISINKLITQFQTHFMFGNFRRISSTKTGRLLILFLLMQTVVTLDM